MFEKYAVFQLISHGQSDFTTNSCQNLENIGLRAIKVSPE